MLASFICPSHIRYECKLTANSQWLFKLFNQPLFATLLTLHQVRLNRKLPQIQRMRESTETLLDAQRCWSRMRLLTETSQANIGFWRAPTADSSSTTHSLSNEKQEEVIAALFIFCVWCAAAGNRCAVTGAGKQHFNCLHVFWWTNTHDPRGLQCENPSPLMGTTKGFLSKCPQQ